MQPFVDHLARKREQDKRKITLVGAGGSPVDVSDVARERSRRSAPSLRGVLDLAVGVARGRRSRPPEVTLGRARRGAADRRRCRRRSCARAIEAVIMGKALGAGLQWMHDAGVLARVLPELDATVDFSQEAGRRHKDVWEHTKQVVRQSVPKPIVRWSALLHDIGKVPTRGHAARRARHVPPPRRGGRAHVGRRSRERLDFDKPSASRSAS